MPRVGLAHMVCASLVVSCTLSSMFIIGMGLPKMVWAEEKDTVRAFEIPAQPLRTSLERFAEQADVQMLYTLDVVEGVQSQAVQGSYPPEQALKILLKGTGLTGERTDTNTITVIKAATSSGAISDGIAAVEAEPQQKPIKVPEILVKDVRKRDDDTKSYIAVEGSTATRTETPLIQVPQSVEVVTQKVIEDQRVIRVEQALRNVSGVALGDVGQSGIAADVAYCRGFPCGYFKNYLRNEDQNQSLTFRDISNIQRLEVLKGPASVLYGRSQPGGIINILTKQPQAERYASIDQIIGNYNYYRTMIDVTGPLNESKTLLFRINGAYENTESFRDIVRGQRYFVSPVFTWLAGNNTTITLEGEYIRDRRTPDFGIPAIGRGLASLPDSRFLGERFDTMAFEEARAGLTVEHRFNSSWRIESRLRMDRSTATAYRTVAAGVLSDNQTMARFIFDQLAPVSSYYWRNDVIGKFSTGSIGHNVLAGAEIGRQYASYDQAAALSSPINIFNPVYGGPVPTLNRTPFSHSFANAIGWYAQDQISLLDNLHVLIGARGDYFYQHSNVAGAETKAEDFAFSPRVGVTYLPIPQLALYANFTRSFIPNFGPFTAARNQFDPSMGTQYEAGAKVDIVPGRLTSTVAVYRLTKTNVLAVDPTAGAGFFVQTGEQRSQGVEVDVTAQLAPGWKVIATYAYTDARITADTTVPVGNRIPLVARNTGSFWTTYDLQSGPLKGLGAGIGLFAVGDRAGDLANSFGLPGYVRTDAALYYRKPEIFTRTNLLAQLNVQNLLDQDYFYSGGQGRGSAAFPGAPTTVLGSIKLEFY